MALRIEKPLQLRLVAGEEVFEKTSTWPDRHLGLEGKGVARIALRADVLQAQLDGGEHLRVGDDVEAALSHGLERHPGDLGGAQSAGADGFLGALPRGDL